MTADVRRWLEAEQVLRDDSRWLGGDDAYSIVLDEGRRLWLFGDSFVDQHAEGDRSQAAFIHNSVGIQDGPDLPAAGLRFFWQEAGPASFIPDEADGSYHWPGHGAMVGGRLLLFTMRIRNRTPVPPDEIETLAFFEVLGWDAFVVDDVHPDPDGWSLRRCTLPRTPEGVLVGSAGVIVEGEWLYAHQWDRRLAGPVRWPVEVVAAGNLSRPQWWCGRGRAADWSADPAQHTPTVTDAQTEFTIHRTRAGAFVLVEVVGLFHPHLRARTAPRIQGPWSSPQVLAELPAEPDAFSYAGKAHPGLVANDLAMTFNTIPTTIAAIRRRPDTYIPRFAVLAGARAGGHNLL